MRILLDCDGVMGDLVTPLLEELNKRYGTEFTKEQVDCWELSDCLHMSKSRIFEVLQMPRFAATIPVMSGAKEVIRHLRSKHDVIVVTASVHTSETWCHDRIKWLYKHFGIHSKDVVFTHRKDLIPGDIFVDDKVENVQGWQSVHSSGHALLMDQPYNQGWDSVGLHRVVD